MSTVVCQQGVHPCKDSSSGHVFESTTIMRLKLVSPKCYKEIARKDDFGGWSFLQSLSSQKPKEEVEKETSYVHPLVKQSSLWKLSQKSLELCTESLGSETGSETAQGSIFSFPEPLSLVTRSEEKTTIAPSEERNLVPHVESKRVASRSFPPPLTTISGSNSLQVRPHREGGRLIIQAMEAPLTSSRFQANRSDGRLRLMLWKSEDDDFDSEEGEESEVPEAENNLKTEEEEEEEEDGIIEEEDNLDVGIEMGIEKCQRPSRCKEDGHGDKGLFKRNWPFWVATS